MEKKTFSVIRVRGTPNKLQLPDGTWVYKEDKFFIPEYGGFVPCAPYLEHFLYQIPANLASKYPGSIYRCSCGSAAIISGVSGYVLEASPQGKLFICQVHSVTGKHSTGGARWI
jgi:hypothetical protein